MGAVVALGYGPAMRAGQPKLIEVALPLAAINREAAREKSIRHRHPSTLHLWWARRPLPAARAVIWASLVDDPSGRPAFAAPGGETDEQKAERSNRIDAERRRDRSRLAPGYAVCTPTGTRHSATGSTDRLSPSSV